ncbi:hypothetical protein MW887_011956 [Aspergillus wentii]|nr:hypothetical protein MW887_011956 [Aspergillus wentii]
MSCSTQNIRRDFIQHWFEEGISGHSGFEDKMMHIATEYPEIFHKYDPELTLLKNMHIALVCLYHHARVTFHRKSIGEIERWDSEKIRWTFFSGLPASKSALYGRDIQPLLDMNVYTEYIKKGGIFCTMHRFLTDWEAGVKRPLTSTNDESTVDSSYTDDTPEPHIADTGKYTLAIDDDTLRTPEAHQ